MIETIVLNYLSEKLKVPCYMEKPEKQPESYVLIEKTSGTEKNKIQYATLTFQSYGGSLQKAATLNEEVKRVLENITDLDSISKAKRNSDYNFTDTTTKRYRYQAVYDFTYF
ncbi:MAG: hypothetical protein MR010_05965 [Lachnospiraceae bacterium]|nr:hypothetical protein [Lachnospiraceae bacterium]